MARHQTIGTGFVWLVGAIALTGVGACDAPEGRRVDGVAPGACVGGKCDDGDQQDGGESESESESEGDAKELLKQLRDCYIANNALETGEPDCLDDVMDAVADVLEAHKVWVDPAPFQHELCFVVQTTTALDKRSRRSQACEIRAEVVLVETTLSIAPIGGKDPLNAIPSDRARQQFEACMDAGTEKDSSDVLECARSKIDTYTDDVRNNLFLDAMEGSGASPEDAERLAEQVLKDLLQRERAFNAQQCEDLAEDHDKSALTENLCQLEYEAQVAFELSLTDRWSPTSD